MKTVEVGYTKKPHGLKGEIKLQIQERYLDDLMQTDVVLINIKGKPTPFFIEEIRVGNAIIAKFEGIDTPEAAHGIASKGLYLREEDVAILYDKHEIDDSLQFGRCIGYAIVDGTQRIGNVKSIEAYPQQEMAIVPYKKREVLIPLHPQLIRKIDDARKEIVMELPEGLLDL